MTYACSHETIFYLFELVGMDDELVPVMVSHYTVASASEHLASEHVRTDGNRVSLVDVASVASDGVYGYEVPVILR